MHQIGKVFFGIAFSLAPLLASAEVSAQAATAPVTVKLSDANYARDFRYQIQFADYLSTRKHLPTDFIFIGDSITEQFRWGPGNPVWKQHFEHRALNFGKGGDRTQHVLWRLDNIDIGTIRPKAAVLLIGTNNQDDAPEQIALGIKAIISKIQSKWQNTPVVLLSILPNARQTDKMAATNKLLPALAEQTKVHYLDVTHRFPRDGDNWKGLQADRLHLTAQGYEALAEELGGLLNKLAK